jgi:hypothetical protein
MMIELKGCGFALRARVLSFIADNRDTQESIRWRLGLNPRTLYGALKGAVGLDASILTDAKEDDPVEHALDGEIQLVLRQAAVSDSQIMRQFVAPYLYGGEEVFVDFGGTPLGPVIIDVFVE